MAGWPPRISVAGEVRRACIRPRPLSTSMTAPATNAAIAAIPAIMIWTLTVTAAAIHLAWISTPELLVGATFVGLGWAGGLALPWMWIHAGVVPGY